MAGQTDIRLAHIHAALKPFSWSLGLDKMTHNLVSRERQPSSCWPLFLLKLLLSSELSGHCGHPLMVHEMLLTLPCDKDAKPFIYNGIYRP